MLLVAQFVKRIDEEVNSPLPVWEILDGVLYTVTYTFIDLWLISFIK